MENEKGSVPTSGMTAVIMKDIGQETKQMAEGNFTTQMEQYMKG